MKVDPGLERIIGEEVLVFLPADSKNFGLVWAQIGENLVEAGLIEGAGDGADVHGDFSVEGMTRCC